jgi:alkyl hydroperoxide reductase subunit AhpF
VHIEVFFSPTCPACTEVVTLAHQFALAGDLIRADAINIREFDALYQSYDPQGTPATLVNGTTLIEGNMSEQEFLQNLLTIVQ